MTAQIIPFPRQAIFEDECPCAACQRDRLFEIALERRYAKDAQAHINYFDKPHGRPGE